MYYLSSLQMNLSSALTKRDINAFRKALHSVDDVERYNGQTSLSIFEYACQTPGCHEFIKECINAGCDVNKVRNIFVYFKSNSIKFSQSLRFSVGKSRIF